jgi:hypothetical protein
MSSNSYKRRVVNCNYCKKDGHYIKSRSGVLTCPVLIAKNGRCMKPLRHRRVTVDESGWSTVNAPRTKVQPISKSNFGSLVEEKQPEKPLTGCWAKASSSNITKPGVFISSPTLRTKIDLTTTLAELEQERLDITDELERCNNEEDKNWADFADIADLQTDLEVITQAIQRHARL